MAKNSITDYSKTASLNTDIQSVDIDEGCLPSGINNAIRELMADLAAVNDGTVALTSPAFTSVDINSGTIDGVTIGGASAAAGTFTTFTSTGIDDNASSTAVTINSSNNVGIGTSSPSSALHVVDSGTNPSVRVFNSGNTADITSYTAQAGLQFISYQSDSGSPYTKTSAIIANGDGTVPSELQFWTKTNGQSSPAERLRIDASGNVGIGVSNPSSYGPFVVSGTGAVGNFNASSGAALVQLYENGAGRFGIQTLNGSAGAKFTVAGAEKIRIDSSGNVGIGTSSPSSIGGSSKLVVNQGADGNSVFVRGGGTRQVQLGTTSTTGYINTDNTNGLTLDVNGTERMRITSGGEVQIGTSTSDTNKLFVYDSDASNSVIYVRQDGAGPIQSWHGSGGQERMRIDSSGRVGIGTTSPNQKLTVQSGTASSPAVNLLGAGSNQGWLRLGNNADIKGGDDYLGMTFTVGASERLRIDGSGRVGIGTSSPDTKFHVEESGAADLYATFENSNAGGYGAFIDIKSTANFSFSRFTGGTKSWIIGQRGLAGGAFSIYDQDNSAHRLTIDSSGRLLVNTTNENIYDNSGSGGGFVSASYWNAMNGVNDAALFLNRVASDGVIQYFFQDGSIEGNISVSGTTVSYNGGHLARWSQLTDGTKDETIVKGTVMTNLDQMAVWSHDAVDAQDAVYDEDGNAVTEAVEAKDAYTEDNEQLNCMAVSSVEGDPNVAGVFVNWDNDDDKFNDMNIAMTGDMVIRIAQGTTVARGDLLMSAGDGTAKPQGDDIVRSKTIAKVTSINVSHTYDDGSYLVPCVLMAC